MKQILLILGVILVAAYIVFCSMTVDDKTGKRPPPPCKIQAEDFRGLPDKVHGEQVCGKKLFVFDPRMPAWAAYDEDGNRVRTGDAAGGKDKCPDLDNDPCRTRVGLFHVMSKGDESCISDTFPLDKGGGAPMPYCMYFASGYAIHGTGKVGDEAHDKLEVPHGHNASHGCIRVYTDAAQWLNENFIDIGTAVLVLPY